MSILDIINPALCIPHYIYKVHDIMLKICAISLKSVLVISSNVIRPGHGAPVQCIVVVHTPIQVTVYSCSTHPYTGHSV